MQVPQPKKIPHIFKYKDKQRTDNYHWFRNDEGLTDDIKQHIESENNYFKQQFKHILPLKKEVLAEFTSRVKKEDKTVPYIINNFVYWFYYKEKAEHPIMYRRAIDCAEEQVVLDFNTRATGKYYSFSSIEVSPTNDLFAIAEDYSGDFVCDISFFCNKTKSFLADKLTNACSSIVWLDAQRVMYIQKDPVTLLGNKVFVHVLGQDQADDVLIYTEKDDRKFISLDESLDGSEFYIHHAISEDIFYSSIVTATADQYFVESAFSFDIDAKYFLHKHEGNYVIVTNWQALETRIMYVSKDNLNDRSAWQELVADCNISDDDVLVHKNNVFYVQSELAKEKLMHIDLVQKTTTEVALGVDFDCIGVSVLDYQFAAKSIHITVSSLSLPQTTYELNIKDLSMTLKKQRFAGANFDSKNYKTELLWATARDNTQVPIHVLYKQDLVLNGTNPLYVEGYSSYGITLNPSFSQMYLSLVDRGFVVALVHARGSGMLGLQWYKAGKLLHKKNTFNDFIDSTKYLIAAGYGDANKVGAYGASAGGLLIGAVINMEPELYKVAVAGVPFVDTLTTMLDSTLPLTTNEYSEWGNPNDAEFYDYIYSYSPYDQVKPQNYPKLYIFTGLHDSAVKYFEPLKWVSKLRGNQLANNEIILQVNVDSGHHSSSGRFESLDKYAFYYSYLIFNLS